MEDKSLLHKSGGYRMFLSGYVRIKWHDHVSESSNSYHSSDFAHAAASQPRWADPPQQGLYFTADPLTARSYLSHIEM